MNRMILKKGATIQYPEDPRGAPPRTDGDILHWIDLDGLLQVRPPAKFKKDVRLIQADSLGQLLDQHPTYLTGSSVGPDGKPLELRVRLTSQLLEATGCFQKGNTREDALRSLVTLGDPRLLELYIEAYGAHELAKGDPCDELTTEHGLEKLKALLFEAEKEMQTRKTPILSQGVSDGEEVGDHA